MFFWILCFLFWFSFRKYFSDKDVKEDGFVKHKKAGAFKEKEKDQKEFGWFYAATEVECVSKRKTCLCADNR